MILNLSDGCIAGSGSGAGLNFKIIGGTVAPTNPRENTIWVNTDNKITGYYFSATQPKDIKEGFVWIINGTSSLFDFNILKKNGVQIYPNSAKQYISGEWLDVVAKIYQNDKWEGLFTYLYNDGDVVHHITGGYSQLAKTGGGESSYYTLISEMREGCIYVHGGYAGSYGAGIVGRCTVNKVDLKAANFLHVVGNCTKATDPATLPHDGNGWVGVRIATTQSLDDSVVAEMTTYKTGDFEFVVDVSSLNDSYYIVVCASGYSGYYGEGTVSKIWYE